MPVTRQTVFLPGGSTGIGLAIARQLAAGGNCLCLFARNPVNLAAAVAELEALGAKAYGYAVDAADYPALQAAFADAVRDAGPPALLVNCVGRAYPRHFEDIAHTDMLDTLRVNFGSMWNAAQLVLPYMKARGGGHVVNTASLGGFIGVFGYADYSASKFAVIGFSEVLKQELRKYGIKVQVLCPPDTETPGFATENQTKPRETQLISESARLMQPDEVARIAVRQMRGSEFMLIPGMDGRLSWWLKRWWPGLVAWVMGRAIRRAQR